MYTYVLMTRWQLSILKHSEKVRDFHFNTFLILADATFSWVKLKCRASTCNWVFLILLPPPPLLFNCAEVLCCAHCKCTKLVPNLHNVNSEHVCTVANRGCNVTVSLVRRVETGGSVSLSLSRSEQSLFLFLTSPLHHNTSCFQVTCQTDSERRHHLPPPAWFTTI